MYPESMHSFFIEMQFAGDALFSARLSKHQGILYRDSAIVLPVCDKDWRGLLGDLLLIGEQIDKFHAGLIPQQVPLRTTMCHTVLHADDRVTQNAKIRSRTLPFNDVIGIGSARVEVCECG